MARVHVQTPGAVLMDAAIAGVFASLNMKPLGGQSGDGWSKISDFLRCEYRYFLRYEIKAPFDDSLGGDPALEAGSLFHAALAVHYAAFLPEGAPGWAPNLPSAMEFLDLVKAYKPELSHVIHAQRLVYGYLEKWNPDHLMEPLAIEVEAGIPGIHTSRYDGIFRHPEYGTVIGEHKTSYRETAEVLEGWHLDGEIIGEVYSWKLAGLDEIYGPLSGVVVNLAFKTATPSYRRLFVAVPPEVVEWYAHDRAHWGAVREHYRRIGYWPRKLTGCFQYNRFCGYRAHCRDGAPTLVEIRRQAGEAKR